MNNPILQVLRWWALRRHRSTAPTSLLPMKEVRRAAVFIDGLAGGEDPAVTGRLIQRKLADRGIEVQLLCAQKQDLDWLGRLKDAQRGAGGEDLFLSMSTRADCFAAEYEARCRTARFKVGRRPLDGGIYDLVVADPEPTEPQGDAQAFASILEILDKIQ